MLKNLYNSINKSNATIGVIGLGYVGLPLSILFAKNKFKVIGFDIDKQKINKLRKRKSYIERIPKKDINKIYNKGFYTNNFSFIKNCNFIIICVPTPLKKNKPNLEYINSTYSNIKNYLRDGQVLILESTSYPGTTREILSKKLSKNFALGKNFFLGFSSERINPGFNESFIQKIPKVVSGYSNNCLKIVKHFYKKFFNQVVQAKSLEIAEFSKLVENIYRAVNIGFINEMKIVADKMNLDIYEILKIAKTKPFGFNVFEPGPGVGGHCIPIDPNYLHWKAKKLGVEPKFIKLSEKINTDVLKFIFSKIKSVLKINKSKNNDKKLLILGLAYKKNVDDLRESASLKLINNLNKFKVKYEFSDPYIKNSVVTRNLVLKKKGIKINPSNLKKFDLVVLMTDHDSFNYKMIYKHSNKIIDCRGRYEIDNKVIRA